MKFAKVVGNVVCTQKDEGFLGWKLLVIQPVDLSFEAKGEPMVAADSVGAGEGELVLFVSGSSARQTDVTRNRPCDCVIAGIVDMVEREGKIVFKKFETEGYN
jgi:microcompartment protein CcmK/EutM